MELSGQPADASSQRDLIASIVTQYLSEARAEPLEGISFSTPLMEAGLDSLDMLKVEFLSRGMHNKAWSCQSNAGYPAPHCFGIAIENTNEMTDGPVADDAYWLLAGCEVQACVAMLLLSLRPVKLHAWICSPSQHTSHQ